VRGVTSLPLLPDEGNGSSEERFYALRRFVQQTWPGSEGRAAPDANGRRHHHHPISKAPRLGHGNPPVLTTQLIGSAARGR
jgi:hypothetical protein